MISSALLDGLLAPNAPSSLQPSATVIILRGIPGSGKSTAARAIEAHAHSRGWACTIVSADHHFHVPAAGRDEGGGGGQGRRGLSTAVEGKRVNCGQHTRYKFDASRLAEAHARCLQQARLALEAVPAAPPTDSAAAPPTVSSLPVAARDATPSSPPQRHLVVVDNTNVARRHYAPYEELAAQKVPAADVLFLELGLSCGGWPGGDDEEGLVSWGTSRNVHGVSRHNIECMLSRWEPDQRARRLLLPRRTAKTGTPFVSSSRKPLRQPKRQASVPISQIVPSTGSSRDAEGAETGGETADFDRRTEKLTEISTASSNSIFAPRVLVQHHPAVAALLANLRIFGTPVGVKRVGVGAAGRGAGGLEPPSVGDCNTASTSKSARIFSAGGGILGLPVLLGPEATLLCLSMGWVKHGSSSTNSKEGSCGGKGVVSKPDEAIQACSVVRQFVLGVNDISRSYTCQREIEKPPNDIDDKAAYGAEGRCERGNGGPGACGVGDDDSTSHGAVHKRSPPCLASIPFEANSLFTPRGEMQLKSAAEWLGSTNTSRLACFLDLWRRGYVVGSGCKYGAHFVAYPGSPLSLHASLSVRVMDSAPSVSQSFFGSNQRRRLGVPALEQISYSRLQQGVVKKAIYAWLVEEDENTEKYKHEAESAASEKGLSFDESHSLQAALFGNSEHLSPLHLREVRPEILVAAAVEALPRLRYARVESHRDFCEVDPATALLQQRMTAAEESQERQSNLPPAIDRAAVSDGYPRVPARSSRKRRWALVSCDDRADSARHRPPITGLLNVVRATPFSCTFKSQEEGWQSGSSSSAAEC